MGSTTNAFTGAINLNQGTLQGVSTNGYVSVTPFGTSTINMNGGMLQMRDAGGGYNGTLFYNNPVTVNPALTGAFIAADNNGGAGTNNTIQMGTLTISAGQTLNTLSATGSYNVAFTGLNTSGGPAGNLFFNPALGTKVAIVGGVNSTNITPVNVGAGTLLLGGSFNLATSTTATTASLIGAAPTANAQAAPFGTSGQTVTLTNGVTFPIVPVPALSSSNGYTPGGLTLKIYSFGTAPAINSAAGSGIAPAAVLTGQPLGDGYFRQTPPLLTTATATNTLEYYGGLLNITNPGYYNFAGTVDDQLAIVIDGAPVTSINAAPGAGGTGIANTAPLANGIYLAAGMHTINIKSENGGGQGGLQVLYSGPDTTSNNLPGTFQSTINPNFQAIPNSALYWASSAGSSGNGYLNAGQILNAFVVANSAAVTIDGQGTDYNSTVAGLTLGVASTTTVNNTFGTGIIGVAGATTVSGTGVVLNPNTGILNLAGGINDNNGSGGYGLTKTGPGVLMLGPAGGTFKGPFAINVGTVMVTDPGALTSGTTTIAAGATLDLNGVTGLAGNIVIAGSGGNTTGLIGAALYNSSAAPASVAGTVIFSNSGSTVAGYGNMTLAGPVVDAPGGTYPYNWTKNGPNILTLSGSNTFGGNVTVTAGVLQMGSSSALSATSTATVTVANGATFDLNGQNIASNVTLKLAAAGVTGLAMNNTLGSLINSSQSPASYSGPITLTGGNAIGSNSYNPAAPGGNLTLSGLIGPTGTASVGFNKVGLDTLVMTGSYVNTGTGGQNIWLGTLDLTGSAGSFTSVNSTFTVTPGAAITLDNTSVNLNNRLGARGIYLNGGSFNVLGNSSSATTELINQGGNNFNFASGGGVITLTPTTGQALTVTVQSTATSLFSRTAGATDFFRGTNLGVYAVGTAGDASLTGLGTSSGGTTNNGQIVGQNGAVGTANVGIMPWALVDTSATGSGIAFATFSTTNGVQALTSTTSNYVTTITTNDNIFATSAIAAPALAQTTINSLTIGGSGGAVTVNNPGSGPSTLVFTSGGVLGLTATSAINGTGWLTTNAYNTELITQVSGTANLTINPTIYLTGGGLTKGGSGTVTLANQEMYVGTTTVNTGTLKLAGGNNTIYFPLATATGPATTAAAGCAPTQQNISINLGGTLDLNGYSQYVGNLINSGGQNLPNTGGTVTNSSSNAATFAIGVNPASLTFAGNITGNINFLREGGWTLTMNSPNTYTGSTTLNGSITVLQDLGTMQNSSSINIARAVLQWDDRGIQAMTTRLSNTASIALNGGAFVYLGRTGAANAISLGAVTAASGASVIQTYANDGTTQVTLASLTQTASNAATLNFDANSGIMGDNPRVFISNFNQSSLINGIIGGWATTFGIDYGTGNSYEFVTYDPASGVRSMMNYSTNVFGAGNNVSTGAITLPAGGAIANSVRLAGNIAFTNAGDTLTVQSGGVLATGGYSIGGSANSGFLTTVSGSGQQTVYLHSPAGTLTVNSRITDNGAPVSVEIDSMGILAGAVTLTGSNTYSGTTYINGAVVNLSAVSGGVAIPGNLIIAGGNGSGNNGQADMPIANATTTFTANNQIATTSNVTILGDSSLNLNNFSNTIKTLTLTTDAGSHDYGAAGLATGMGTLTVSGSINATGLTNSWGIANMNGFLNLNGGQTVNVDPVVNVPQQIGLAINSAMLNGSLTKTGSGVLAIGGQSPYNGVTNINQGTLTFNTATANIGQSAVILAAGATLDTRGIQGATIGSLSGSGLLTNNYVPNLATAGTLVTGLDNTNTTFSGAITNPDPASLLNLTKIGAGTWNLSGSNSGVGLNSPNLGALTVSGGAVTLSSTAATIGFDTYSLNAGGALTLDNTLAAISNRLGGAYQLVAANVASTTSNLRTMNLQGGALNVINNSGLTVTENLGTVNVGNGIGGGSVVTLSASSNSILNATINTLAQQNGYGTALIRGGGTASAAGVPTITASTFNVPFATGGTNGTTSMSIRPDIVGDMSATGAGTGFLVKDSSSGLLRPLNQTTELAPSMGTLTGSTYMVNVGLGASQTVAGNVALNSLTLLSGVTVGSPAYNGSVTFPALSVTSAGILALTGTSNINVPITTNGISTDIHVVGAGSVLNVNAPFFNTSSGLVKADAGALVFNTPQYYYGTQGTNINGGLLQLNGGNNTILVQPTATVPSLLPLTVSAGTLDLYGWNQSVGALSSVNSLPGMGGTITNSSANAANFIVSTAVSSSTFGGTIASGAGTVTFTKQGANTLLLSGTSSPAVTNIEGGTLTLRDGGTLAGNGPINVNYATLNIDNTGLLDSTSRLGTSPLTLNGGALTFTGRQLVETMSMGSLTANQGASSITINQPVQYSGALSLSLANLAQTGSNGATVNFANGSNVTLGQVNNPMVFISGSGSATTNGMLGGWATYNGTAFAGYSATQGVGALGATGFTNYAGSLTAGAATNNVNTTATTTGVTTTTINSLTLTASAAMSVTMNSGTDTLTLGTGGLLETGNYAVTIGGGNLTAGAASGNTLYGYINQNTTTINSNIANKGSAVSLVKAGGGTLTLTPSAVVPAATYASGAGTIQMVSTGGTTGLFAGEIVNGAGLTGGTVTIASILSGGSIGLSAVTSGSAAAASNLTFTAPSLASTATLNSNQVTVNLTSGTQGWAAGMAVGGTGIPAGTTIAPNGISFLSGTQYTLTLTNSAFASSSGSLTYGAPSNSYSGTTIVNQGTLNLTGQVGSIVVPGNLTVNGGAVTMNANAGQIAPSSNVALSDGAVLTLTGSNVLNSVSFAGIGGTTQTSVNINSGLLTLSASNVITAQNDNLAMTPQITGGSLAFTSATPTINTSGLSTTSLVISAPIVSSNGAINVNGTGAVVFSSTGSIFTNGVNLNSGSIVIAGSNTFSGSTLVSGPLGSGTLTTNSGSLLGGLAAQTIANPTVVNGTLNFGGTIPGNGLTLTSSVSLGTANTTMAVASPLVMTTLAGPVSGNNLVKTGAGTLVLANTGNSYGNTTISGGVLVAGGSGALGTGTVTLNGGRLQIGSQGLLGQFFTGETLPNPQTSYNLLSTMNTYFSSLPANDLVVTAPTVTNGKTNLDFSQNGTTTLFGVIPTGTNTANYGFTPATNYEVKLSGYINLATAGTYTFTTTSDDGSMLFMNNQNTPVVSNNAYQGSHGSSGTFTVTTPGWYPITTGYYQGTGSETFLVQYALASASTGSFGTTTVPNSVLSTVLPTSQTLANNVTVTNNSTINVNALNSSGTLAASVGNVTIGSNTLYTVGAGGFNTNVPYYLTTGTVAVSGSSTFDVANNGTGLGTLTLGAIADGGTAATITKSDNGLLVLASAAISLVNGTQFNITGGTLNPTSAGAMGTLAQVNVGGGALLSLGVSARRQSAP